jgi:glycosyltransferase involved in cell wall biosynthesis
MTAHRAFWGATWAVLYTYVGFPLLVLIRGRLRPQPHSWDPYFPSVSLIVAAHNEAGVIRHKLENLLTLDYEQERIQILVVSDGSDDGTNDLVAEYAGRGVELLALPRVGKAAALNRAVQVARGDILVFSDANSIYAPDAVREIVTPFSDPMVGGVAGDQRYLEAGAGGDASGEGTYWDFDRLLKRAESRAGNVISATGAIYAIRREHFDPVPEGVTDDFYVSTGAVCRGRRLVFQERAIAYEPVAATGQLEFQRKVRVITRGLRAVLVRRELLNPQRHGFYAVQLFSHKVLRRVMVIPLTVIGMATPALLRRGRLYRVAAGAQLLVYGTGVAGLLWAQVRGASPRLLRAPAYFCLVNYACVRAILNLVTGRTITRWEPGRPASGSDLEARDETPQPVPGELS